MKRGQQLTYDTNTNTAHGLKSMIPNFWENPKLGGIMDFSTVMIPVLNSPRAENHDTKFPAEYPKGCVMNFSKNSFCSGCQKLV